MLKKIIIVVVLLFTGIFTNAQTLYVLSGNVTDMSTGESLVGAAVAVAEKDGIGAFSNSYGFYSLSLESGEYRILVQFTGYETMVIPVDLRKNTKLDIELNKSNYEIGGVVVTGQRADRNVTSVEMGKVQLAPKQIESIPVIFGEPDILKTIQLTAGVKPAGEGNSGFYVRGGGIDQNLILLDEAPVYSASHLLGFFSVFNSEALKSASLLKGSIPAEFGGRASSVLDIQMNEGNMKRHGVSGNLGLISSNLTVEGPIVKDKSSFMLSGRRTYADLFLNLSSDDDIKNTYLYFYDLNMKANYKIDGKNRIYLSGYLGRDDFGYKKEFGFDWGSITGTLRWNHIFSERLFANTSLIFSNYSYNINVLRDLDLKIRSEIQDVNLKQDFSFYMNADNTLKFGFNIINHRILPGEVRVNEGYTYISPENISRRRAVEWAGYVSNSWRTSDKIKLYYGLRLALFSNIGPGEFYEFDDSGELIETIQIGKGKSYKTQGGLEPRLGFNYTFTNRSSVKASYNRIYQFLHLLTNSTTTTPTDLWLPSSNNVKPQISDQFSVGYFQNFKSNEFESSIEFYYKNLQNQIDYKNGADLMFNSTVESELVFGRGWAYGAELMLKRNFGRLNGWFSYTWSKTMRQFDEISNGNPFPARHDRTHDISVVAMYDITRKLKLSATWVFYTGNAVTFPSGKYEIDGKTIGYYTERNGYRMPDYHRMDLGLVWQLRKTTRFESSLNFSVYNAYARENAYFIDFRTKEDNPDETEAVQVSLFRAIPSISYRFKF
ncbi:TonB-dependent Receptor Plug Domain [Mariniphaga anaerophila]|uniref:TonB-dependent Receptor Plug Domain n=1 Tax=Mariniphaga anaerophila TaxID=1484053 RepID=A0A1M4SZB4_9BACT|nr:TonB-dependent receptor [Mariniphaga anaerophila]SHE37513.1 TonB-dependent Receptor Plug Domain [Mariniphaga anaerophila]